MTSQLELNSRAELCRQLARQEPAHRALWIAEAENWSRQSKEASCAGARKKVGLVKFGFDLPARLRSRSAKRLPVLASTLVRSLQTPYLGLKHKVIGLLTRRPSRTAIRQMSVSPVMSRSAQHCSHQ
jgi:hypothetical protein